MKTYKQSLKTYRDNYSVMKYVKEEGRQEGREEGRQEGKQEGRMEGRQEERLAIAKMMKENGASTELIEKYTGLAKEQIEGLE